MGAARMIVGKKKPRGVHVPRASGKHSKGDGGMTRHSLAAKSFAVLALGAAVALGAARPAAAEVPESKDPIKIALMDWTSVNLNAHIYGDILKKLGYNVEYVTADYLSSLTTGPSPPAISTSASNTGTPPRATR